MKLPLKRRLRRLYVEVNELKIDKLKSISTIPPNPEADIDLINKYSLKELTPQDVFCFSVTLCDNDVDRDDERFTDDSLDKLAPMFLGKTVLFDHRWSAEKQVARLYRTFVEQLNEKTATGEPKKILRGSAYMLRTDETDDLIKAIEGGIKKEVSVGCQMGDCKCSICGEKFKFNWETWKYLCENSHFKGEIYDGKMCVGDLTDPKDAYEVSFVAVPAQRGAGVTKGLNGELADLLESLKTTDLSKIDQKTRLDLLKSLQMSLAEDNERAERTKIIEENKKYIGGM
jgi:hypothetical protein